MVDVSSLPPLNQITQQQTKLYESYFRQVNPSGTGTVGAAEAATFLKKSGLPEGVLHTIWDLSDIGSKGYLDKTGFYIALKLISLAQNGKDVNVNNLALPTSPPRMGESPNANRGAPPRDNTLKTDANWAITAKEKVQYDHIFDGLSPANGLLSGEKVKPVLLNSKLPVEVLGKIWDISDIDLDGSLDRDEFSVAMHLVYKALNGEMVPATLPLILIPPSKRKVPISRTVVTPQHTENAQRNIVVPQHTGNAQRNVVVPQHTGNAQRNVVVPQHTGNAQRNVVVPQHTGNAQRNDTIEASVTSESKFTISSADREKYKQLFFQADSDKDGLVSGHQVKDILLASALPQQTLAHIWTLCDKDNTGMLTVDQFSFVMHLIVIAKAGHDLPTSVEMINILETSTSQPLLVKASSDLANISLESSSSDFSAIKELDQITSEIEQLGREKISLQKEISETEEAIRSRKMEIEELQNELLKGKKGLEVLQGQKAKSKSQLDSLDEEKSKYEMEYNDIQLKIEEEKVAVNQLKSQHKSHQDTFKSQEHELLIARKELDNVRKEESELEIQVKNSITELDLLKEKLSKTKGDTNEVQLKIGKHTEENNMLKYEIAELSAVANNNGSTNLTELTNDNFEARFKDVDQISARATAGSSPVSSISGFSGSGGCRDDEENDEDDENDEFKDSDLFKHKDDHFGGKDSDNHDPFTSDDPFKDPFKTVTFQDPFAPSQDPFQDNDPFKDIENTVKPTPKDVRDPFTSSDPFGSGAFVTTMNGNPTSGIDPFSAGNLFGAPESNREGSPEIDKEQPLGEGQPFSFGTRETDNISDPFAVSGTTDAFASYTDNRMESFATNGSAIESLSLTDKSKQSSNGEIDSSVDKDDPFASQNNMNDPFSLGEKLDPFADKEISTDPFLFKENIADPFVSGNDKSDPFTLEKAKSDPFATEYKNDPFLSSENDDPFASDPFALDNSRKEQFGTEIKSETSSIAISEPNSVKDDRKVEDEKADLFAPGKEDPFLTINQDPFVTDTSPATNKEDPFLSTANSTTVDLFAVNDPFTTTASSDPFSSNNYDPFSIKGTDDPFVSEIPVTAGDPFKSDSSASDSWFAFGNSINPPEKPAEKTNMKSSEMTEESQLEWAKRESEREETERKKRLKQLQDEEEMQIALALKHSVESSSDA